MIGVFLFGVANLWRAVSLMGQSSLLLAWGVAFDPRARAVVALAWALLFVAATVVLWQRRPFSRTAIPVLLLVYILYRSALFIFFVESTVARRGWPAYLVFYAAVILLSTWLLNRPAVRTYFTEQQQP
jgi:hypothetical protein